MSQSMANAVEGREEMTGQNPLSYGSETGPNGQGNPEKESSEISGMQIPPDILAFMQSQGISPQQAIAFIRGQSGIASGRVNSFIRSLSEDHGHAGGGCDCEAENPAFASPASTCADTAGGDKKTCGCGSEGYESGNPQNASNGGSSGFQQKPVHRSPGQSYGNEASFSHAFQGPVPGNHAAYMQGYTPGPMAGNRAGYTPGPVPGSHAGYAQGPVPGNHAAYMQGYTPGPMAGNQAGYTPGHASHSCGGPGPRHFKHEQHQYGQMMEIVNDFANGTPNVGKVMDFMEISDSRFWKGAVAGIALTLLLTNDTVKKTIFGAMGNLMQPFRKEHSDTAETSEQTS